MKQDNQTKGWEESIRKKYSQPESPEFLDGSENIIDLLLDIGVIVQEAEERGRKDAKSVRGYLMGYEHGKRETIIKLTDSIRQQTAREIIDEIQPFITEEWGSNIYWFKELKDKYGIK